MNTDNSEKLYKEALAYFPGGVNSPVRAFRSVEGTPLFIERGNGCRITDVDGNEFIDFCCSWGPLILGHNHSGIRNRVKETVEKGLSFGAPTREENVLANLIISNNKYVEKIRFVSSGTEAVMSAIRLARGITTRNKIIKFDGCYHGHSDSLLVKAGSGLATFGTSSSAGVPQSFAAETIVLPLNDRDAVSRAFKNYKDQIACVIIEPVPANNGLLVQDKGYLQFLKDQCVLEGSLLIFDEVISGFRLGFEGASGYYDIQPDIVTYGKIIGGGMPVGAFGGRKEIMTNISPDGNVYQAGTLSGNPVAMAAGEAQLKECLKPGFYDTLKTNTENFINQLRAHIQEKNYPVRVFSLGSIFWLSFSENESIQAAHEIDGSGMKVFAKFHRELLERGVYLGPSGYEVGFISSSHKEDDLNKAARAISGAMDKVFS